MWVLIIFWRQIESWVTKRSMKSLKNGLSPINTWYSRTLITLSIRGTPYSFELGIVQDMNYSSNIFVIWLTNVTIYSCQQDKFELTHEELRQKSKVRGWILPCYKKSTEV